MTRNKWVAAFALMAMLAVTTASANAQFISSPTVIPYRAPAYGPYYGSGMSYIQPGSLSYLTVPSYPIYSGYGYGYGYGNYNTPGFGVGYSNYRYSNYPAYYGTSAVTSPAYTAPYYRPYVSPLLYQGW